jgi:glycosyltransferase involved in cell wall biosynthesis
MVGPHPLPGEAPVGGIEVVMETLVRSLHELGAEVRVITCSPSVRRATRMEHDDVAFVVVPTSRGRGRATMFLAEREAIGRAIAEARPHVAHAQGSNFYGPATLAAGLPTVVTPHGIFYKEAHITDRSSGLRERISKRLCGVGNTHFERVTLARATDLVIISPYVDDAVRGRTSARLHPVPNPVAAEFYDVPRHPIDGQLLFVGSIEARKNVLGLVRAFASTRDRLPHARLRLIGAPKDREYHASVLSAIASADPGRISYVGVVPQARLLEEYGAAAALVLPSREESSPMVIQQAMAAGVPVLASRAGGIERLVAHDVTGVLTSPGDDVALADAIVSLLASPALDAMGEKARGDAERFRAGAVAAETMRVYEQVASRGEAPSGRAR